MRMKVAIVTTVSLCWAQCRWRWHIMRLPRSSM